EALMIPELALMARMVSPRNAAHGPAMKPMNGMLCASSATGSLMLALNACHGSTPRPSVENAMAKMNTVKMSVIDVRGMIVAGRRVSCAACEIDSRPTNEMIASDEP